MQSLDPFAHVNAIYPASTSTTNTLNDTTDTVQPQRQLTLPKILPPDFQGDPLTCQIGFFSYL